MSEDAQKEEIKSPEETLEETRDMKDGTPKEGQSDPEASTVTPEYLALTMLGAGLDFQNTVDEVHPSLGDSDGTKDYK
ncbi:hypothetical protein AgCh_028022 [Apium graveolens]